MKVGTSNLFFENKLQNWSKLYS